MCFPSKCKRKVTYSAIFVLILKSFFFFYKYFDDYRDNTVNPDMTSSLYPHACALCIPIRSHRLENWWQTPAARTN